MTADITFYFDKKPGTLAITFNEARLGSTLVEASAKDVSSGVSGVFGKLIESNKAKYEGPLLQLRTFSFTLENNPHLEKRSIKIEAADYSYSLTLTKVSEKTATLFMGSIPQNLGISSISPAEQAQLEAEKLRREVLDEEEEDRVLAKKQLQLVAPPEKPVEAAGVPTAPQDDFELDFVHVDKPAAASSGSKENISVDEKIVAVPPKSSQEKALENLRSQMNEQFNVAVIKRSEQATYESFGLYLMDQIFRKAKSHDYKMETGKFTITFAEEQTFNLTKIPKDKSAGSLIALNQLKDSILTMSKEIKGEFKENKVVFEPESLTLTWPNAWLIKWAELQDVFETQGATITMHIKTRIGHILASIPAQDFVDFVEYNLPLNTTGTV
jgi:hypothetical protein